MYNINVKMNFSNWAKTIVKIKMITLITLFIIVNSCVSMQNVKVVNTVDNKYLQLKQQFAWMNPEIYGILKKEIKRQEPNLPRIYKMVKGLDNNYKVYINFDFIKFMSSLISAESGEFCNNNYEYMKRVHSYAGAIGICQMLAKYHSPKNPEALYNPNINVQKGVSYFTMCLQKSIREGHRAPLQIACLYYNAGAGAKIWRYKNWSYVNKIAKYYGKA